MDRYLTDAVSFCYDNIAIVFLLLCGIYYLLFRRNVNFINILPDNECWDSDSVHDTSVTVTHCNDKNCVRCHLYSHVSRNAMYTLNNVTDPQFITIADKIKGSLFPNCAPESENRRKQNPNVVFYSDLQSDPYWNSDEFDDTKQLENNYIQIYEEFLNVFRRDNMKGWKRNTTHSGSWDVFPLVNQGSVISDNASRCPRTMKIIHSLPSAMLRNVFSNVVYSVVRNSTTISEHYGPTNIRLRCHLGLLTTPACTLTVSDQVRTWETGKCIVFDDSFLHSVTYEQSTTEMTDTCTDEYRAILIVDLWHPIISANEKELLDTVFAPLTADTQ